MLAVASVLFNGSSFGSSMSSSSVIEGSGSNSAMRGSLASNAMDLLHLLDIGVGSRLSSDVVGESTIGLPRECELANGRVTQA